MQKKCKEERKFLQKKDRKTLRNERILYKKQEKLKWIKLINIKTVVYREIATSEIEKNMESSIEKRKYKKWKNCQINKNAIEILWSYKKIKVRFYSSLNETQKKNKYFINKDYYLQKLRKKLMKQIKKIIVKVIKK